MTFQDIKDYFHILSDGQFHSYGITISYSAKVNANDDYKGYLMVDDIKVYQNGNPLSFTSEDKEDK